MRESAQIGDTAGENDLFRLLRRHLPLNRSLRSLGRLLDRGSRYSCSLFPVPWDEVPDKSEFSPSHKSPARSSRRG